MTPLETYLHELHAIRATGGAVPETSYYPAVSGLLNAVGKTLKPPVRCVMNLKNQGAGLPDGGLYTPDQAQKVADLKQRVALLPARGVLEVKGTGADIAQIVASEQVARYAGKYGQVLVTNLRDFALVGRDAAGRWATLETFSLAPTEADFWARAAAATTGPHPPTATAAALGERFEEYLKRVLLSRAPLATPEDVAWFLASYARDARSRIARADLPALASVRTALEDALGLKFTGERGEHFFRSTLVQTLFYGIFSAWVLWCKKHPHPGLATPAPASGRGANNLTAVPPDKTQRIQVTGPSPFPKGDGVPDEGGAGATFDWRSAAWELHVPMIRALFEEVAKPSRLGPLGLVEVLDWTGQALNRVDRAAFFERFAQGQAAVQYFYEPFLQAFDPELRKQLGVWYTPPEIVRYMVARVDRALREELDIPDGLADPRVYVLDPCCGTGAYLVEVLHTIHRTLDAQGGDALGGSDLKRAAMERVFGFELLPAPFVVAHLQLGLLLQNAGAPLSDAHAERAGVFLTNALTGWEPPQGPRQHLLYPEMEAERDQADAVKQHTPILVILGNPPYNSFAGVAVEEERALSLAYRTTRTAPAPQGQGLNDLYVRFFRMAERRIAEQTGQGLVCFISNYSWLDGLSHTGMRERYLEAFDDIWIDNLNGDKYKTGKVTPEGLPDPSVFSTEVNREGIQVGTAIALLVRKQPHREASAVHFKNWWGRSKRADLLASLGQETGATYHSLVPAPKLGLPYLPLLTGDHYQQWPRLMDLFPASFPGIQPCRDDVVVDIDRERLVQRMTKYFDPSITHDEMRQIAPNAVINSAGFDAIEARSYLQKRGFLPGNIVRYSYRPFDVRWLYWEPETRLLDRNRADYVAQISPRNVWIAATQQNRKSYDPPIALASHGSRHIIERGANLFPIWLKPKLTEHLFADADTTDNGPELNLSNDAAAYLAGMEADAESLFYHTLAMLHAPAYREENAGALRQDWPRVPLPDNPDALTASAALGRRIAALLDTETPVPNVTTGALSPELKTLGVITRVGGGTLAPEQGDLKITAGWGHGGQGGVTMPGKGKSVTRDYTPDERAALGDAATALLGADTRDISLNGVAYWRNVPARVWDYTLGGYQVMKKWLSYREYPLLGRDLTPAEAREVTAMARRLAALRLLEPALDAHYQAVKAATESWPVPRSPEKA